MSNDVLITPASRKIEFKDSSANVDAKIETDASGNLVITNTGGDISIGDTTSDIFVGDGTNNIDIVFEQDGEIRGTSGVTVTLGASGSNIRMASDLNLNSNDITNVNDLTVAGNLTVSGTTTTVNSTNTTISDSIIELNSGLTGANTKDIGFIFERGSTGNNAGFVWDESADRFTVFTTTDTASSDTVNTGSVANFQAGSFYGNGANLTSLNGSNISSGTVAAARIASLDASKITSGTFADARISSSSVTQHLGSYLTGNQTITLSGDVSGSGTTSISVTVADDSHNHVISNVDGLQTALDGKLSTTGTAANSQLLDSLDSTAFLRSDAADTATENVTFTKAGDAITIESAAPQMKFNSTASGEDDFWIHVNDNNFYVLVDRDGNGTWDGAHPLQLEGDTNIGYLFGQRIFNEAYHPNADTWTTARTITLGGDLSGSVSINGSANVTLTATVANDSHNHAFNNLTAKTSGTGEYSTSGYLTAGRGSGGVSLTHNDGYGNANVTFNHKAGVPEQNGNSARIEVNTDSTSDAQIIFGINSNVSSGVAVQPINAVNIRQDYVDIRQYLRHMGDDDTYLRFDVDRVRIFAGGTAKFDSNNTYLTSTGNTTGTAGGLSGTPNISVGTISSGAITSTGNSQFDGEVQVGDTVSQNAFGLLQVNQEANNDESGIGILSSGAARSMRLWVDETSSYINSGNAGGGNLIFNEAITVSSGGNLTGVGTISSGAITATNGFKADGIWTSNEQPTGDDAIFSGYGAIGNRGTFYITNGGGTVQIGNGSVHNNNPTTTFSTSAVNLGASRVLQMNGTTVIDSSRNLTNIGTISSGDITLADGSHLQLYTSNGTTGTGGIDLPRGGHITFYGNNNVDHSIGSRSSSGAITDDLRISSYGALYIDLDSNNNNDSAANFVIGKHGSGDGTMSTLVTISGENGNYTSSGSIQVAGNITGVTDLYVADQIIHTGDTNTYIQFQAADQFRVVTGGGERLEVNNNGVNIPQTSKLKFDGDGHTYISEESDSNFKFYVAGVEAVNMTNSGVYFGNDLYIPDQIRHTGDTNTYMQFHAADQWRVVTGGTERLEVNNTRTAVNSGYLQVTGSTSHLVSTTTSTAATTRLGLTATHKSAVVLDTSSTGTTGTRRIYAIENNAGANLRIGNPDYPNAFNVTSTGNISSTGDVIAYSSSDRRFKDNITPISNPMEKINKLSGNTFEWNGNQETYEKGMKDVGVIAQEVEEVLPEIVDTREDGYKAVKYEKIVALLIEGMKEQQEQIEKLKELLENK